MELKKQLCEGFRELLDYLDSFEFSAEISRSKVDSGQGQ